tara:strand:- start:117 stop:704 length:588 start_codon:yes stop_codon:yes gene_type:complete
MTLPAIFFELEKRFVPNHNYIISDKKLVKYWKKKINSIKGHKIGLCWQGDPNYGRDFMRSVPLKNFEKLFLIPDLNFINFTKGFGSEQIINFKYKDKIYDYSNEFDNGDNSFEDTIAILENIDLLITIDTAVAHVASTMNVKTWLLLDYSADWRWHVQKKKFNWYDNQKFFRQKKIYSWNDVMEQIVSKLKNYKF